MSDGVFFVLSDSVQFVINNGDSAALTTSGTGGANIISEGEANSVKWNIGTNTGTYTVPFTTTPSSQGGNGTQIPTILQITSAGTGSGSVSFSSFETTNDNNTPYASQITHMNGVGGDQSLKVLDRFWMVNAQDYTAKPGGKLTLSYDDASNEMGGTNTITESTLQAQRWSTTSNDWEFLLYGTVNTASNTVSDITLTSTDFFSTWAIVSSGSPLPIQLAEFEASCEDNGRKVRWATASEINNERFELEYSFNGKDFELLATLSGNGTSNNSNEYSIYDEQTSTRQLVYYRLTQFDYDGKAESFPIISSKACIEVQEQAFKLFPNPSSGTFYLSNDYSDLVKVKVTNQLGQVVFEQEGEIQQFDLNHLSEGSYNCIVSLNGDTHYYKLVLNRN